MAIADGRTETGVSIMYVAREMDAGDVILQRTHPIEPEDTFATLMPRLAQLGAGMVMEVVDLIRAGRAPRHAQDHDRATYVPRLTKADGKIDWAHPAETLRNRVRGFTPWPGCFCEVSSGEPLKVWAVAVEPGVGSPGEVLCADGEGPLVATGDQALRLVEVQPAGKKRMTGSAYLNGRSLCPGDRLG
jgi:methionyl-tRNA formyltransferase